MTIKKLNMEDVKINNRGSLVKLLYNHEPISRLEIAEQLDLTPASVSIICNDFLTQGLIIQHADLSEPKRVGRKSNPVELNYNYKHVLEINIRTSECNISITNLKGDIVACTSVEIIPLNETMFLSSIVQSSIKLMWDNNLNPSSILGVGVIVIGPVDSKNGISLHAFNIFDRPVNLKKYFEKAFGMPVCVESNVCAILLSEVMLNKLKDDLNILAVKWGPGIGSASFLNGRIFKGNNHHSTEIGHCSSSSSKEVCRCGKIGCLETVMSVDAMSKKINALAKNSKNTQIINTIKRHGAPSNKNIMKFIHCHDKEFDCYIETCCKELSVHISDAVSMLIPDRILLYGEILTDEYISQMVITNILELNNKVDRSLFMIKPKDSSYNYEGALGLVIQKLLIEKGGVE